MKNSVLLPALILFFISSVNSFAQNQGKKEITIEGGNRGPITFLHAKHQERINDCMVCHKTFPQKDGGIKALQLSEQLKKKQVMNKTCLNCHRELKKAGKKYGPVKCSGCHIK